ncbi:hypothetical protein V6N13_064095 [Hibiscus sabdariffa]|uniref:Uncharacterized protein n=1 Tax=Hibiscus sabdariffa TaxID=183260 RepID=A0ABR2R2K0_9ROSI
MVDSNAIELALIVGLSLSLTMVSLFGFTTINGVGDKTSNVVEKSSSFKKSSNGLGILGAIFASLAVEASSEECTDSSIVSLSNFPVGYHITINTSGVCFCNNTNKGAKGGACLNDHRIKVHQNRRYIVNVYPNIHGVESMVLSIQSRVEGSKGNLIIFEEPRCTVHDFSAVGCIIKLDSREVGLNWGNIDKMIFLPYVGVGTYENLIVNLLMANSLLIIRNTRSMVGVSQETVGVKN